MLRLNEVPESSQIDISERANISAMKFFEIPENMEAYKKWAEERRSNQE